jgi:uncharacterized membrane protein YhaH (DUF805 family)
MRHYLNAMRRYFDFSGRSSRAEFWFFVLFVFILSVVANVLDVVLLGSYGYGAAVLSSLVSLIHFIPSLSVSVRRLHDIDRTGWWIMLAFVPVAGLIVAMGGSVMMMFGGGEIDGMSGLAAMGTGLMLTALIFLIVLIVLLVFYCTPSTPGPNRYGPPPPP